ncbi:hypothetical protein llg_21710 [Luteolibacter sp. LG18]|nr:hypothetical protein llg_21710 [Luteolibacter sp. LG18]
MIVLAGSAALLASCGSKNEGPPLASHAPKSKAESEGLYWQAKKADDSGDREKAIKLYKESAEASPTAPNSAQARFRQGQLLEQKGDLPEAFDAYEKLILGYQGSGYYTKALDRQISIANTAANGHIKTSFLGLKSGLSRDKVVGMLEQVRESAPKSSAAAAAQLSLGQLYQQQKKDKEAVEAYKKVVSDYPDRPEAPEAQFRVAQVYIQQAQRGNQNQATINLAREALQDYLNQYPNHHRAGEARRLMADLGGQSVQRSFDVAEFYLKTKEYESAKVYYREVVRRAGTNSLGQKAKSRLAELGEH